VAFIATTLERMMRQGTSGTTDRLLVTWAEAVVHDFFRDHPNYFRDLEVAAEALRGTEAKSTPPSKRGFSTRTAFASSGAPSRR
jgi:hypothetical protein